jgi:2-dehydro-3-deoxygluconokinase
VKDDILAGFKIFWASPTIYRAMILILAVATLLARKQVAGERIGQVIGCGPIAGIAATAAWLTNAGDCFTAVGGFDIPEGRRSDQGGPPMTARVLCVGEGMAELSANGAPGAGADYRLGIGGDTLNTALYLARLLGPGEVGYVTRLGDDLYSARLRAAWEAEGIDCSLVETVIGATVGLYAIDTDQRGERSFTYWRSAAPARELFSRGNWHLRAAAIGAAATVYLSGISLAILPEEGRARLIEAAGAAKAAGARVAVDPNFRQRLWPREEATPWMARAYGVATVALTSAEEEAVLFADIGKGPPWDHHAGFGFSEVVAKAGPRGAIVVVGDDWCEVPAEAVASAVDTTGAGDAFNAAYLAARIRGLDPQVAAGHGCRLGSRVVAHRGAIIPRDAMADLIEEFAHAGR